MLCFDRKGAEAVQLTLHVAGCMHRVAVPQQHAVCSSGPLHCMPPAHAGDTAALPCRILVLGGAGFVVGLATFGYKIMSVLGASPQLLHRYQRTCFWRALQAACTCFWRAIQAACMTLRHSLPPTGMGPSLLPTGIPFTLPCCAPICRCQNDAPGELGSWGRTVWRLSHLRAQCICCPLGLPGLCAEALTLSPVPVHLPPRRPPAAALWWSSAHPSSS